MSEGNPASAKKSRALSARRLALLASVAGLSAFVVLGGAGLYRPSGLNLGTPTARAAEAALPHPAGFADIVAKVKPAVISVRVKIKNAAEPAMMREGGGDEII
ncbi:MAG: serine peptidase, partial [Pseudomonadota bacterium]